MNPADDQPRGVWREIQDTWEVLVDLTRRPKPYPVLYLRCDSCGKGAPGTRPDRTHGAGMVHTAAPEYPCPRCGAYSPRGVGDQIDPDDPDVDTVTMPCTVRFGCFQFWRHCNTTFTAPAAATVVGCTT